MDNLLLFRPKPFINESLTGYLQRIAEGNAISPHQLWREYKVEKTHYPQTDMGSVIDFVPSGTLDICKLSFSLDLVPNQLINLTFQNLLAKFYPKETENAVFSSSQILLGLINSERKFCPECIKERSIYKLIWQVREIEYCDKHRIVLQSKLNISFW